MLIKHHCLVLLIQKGNIMLSRVGLLSVVGLLALSGCGGGSSDSPNNNQNNSPNSTVSNNPTLQIYNYLNNEISRCGFGGLKQNAKIETATKNHAKYIFANNKVDHNQFANQPHFTGFSVANRLEAVGYRYNKSGIGVGEVLASISSTNTNTIQNSGISLLRNLMIAPYHMTNFVAGFKDVGISYEIGNINNKQTALLVANFGVLASDKSHLIDGNQVLTYPCQGSSNIQPALYNEYPNPVPNRDLQNKPIGSSIILRANVKGNLVITSQTLKNLATGKNVPLLPTLTQKNDPNKQLFAFEAVVMPDQALDKNTIYQAVISGTNNGSPFSKNFTFTTGN